MRRASTQWAEARVERGDASIRDAVRGSSVPRGIPRYLERQLPELPATPEPNQRLAILPAFSRLCYNCVGPSVCLSGTLVGFTSLFDLTWVQGVRPVRDQNLANDGVLSRVSYHGVLCINLLRAPPTCHVCQAPGKLPSPVPSELAGAYHSDTQISVIR